MGAQFNGGGAAGMQALTKLQYLDKNKFDDLVNRVPDDWMSLSAKKFAIALMCYSLEQLQALFQ